MRLRQLIESPSTAVFAFGRMNPPTIGHKKLADKVKSIDGSPFLFLTHSQKPKTDPLTFAEKVFFATKSFGDGIRIGDNEVRTIIQAMQKLQQLGFKNIVYVAGSDRVSSFTKLLNDYNGKDYQFDSIDVVSAGERDPDADGTEGMSASKMRAAATEGDFDSFESGVAVKDPKLAKMMYTKVRQGMGITEEDVNELNVFKSKVDNASIKAQDPNKLKVLDWVSSRTDGREHFLSFYRKGAAWSGKLMFIKPDQAKAFMQKVEANDEYLPQIKQALTNIATAGKLFDRFGIKYQISRAD